MSYVPSENSPLKGQNGTSALYETISVHRSEDGRVATILIDRQKTRNSLTFRFWREFDDALKNLEADHNNRVIILKGAGVGFSSGHDLTGSEPALRDYKIAPDDPTTRGNHLVNVKISMQQVTDVMLSFWNISRVTIAQLHGFALAGGLELAMMADLVVATENCRIGHPGLRGLGSARNGNIWPLVIGMRKAKELYFTGDSISGVEAERMEMINYAWPEDEIDEKTIALANRIAISSSDHLAVLKMTMNKFYENMGIYSSVRSATEHDALIQTSDFFGEFIRRMVSEGPKAAFTWRESLYGE